MRVRIWIVCIFLVCLHMIFPDSYAETIQPTVHNEGGNIFLKVAGKVTQLTTTGRDGQPALSPNGRWGAFYHTKT